MKVRIRKEALFLLVLVVMCLVTSCACMPKQLETSDKGKTGMPTSVFDQGTAPIPWRVEQSSLPLYPGSKVDVNWRSFITPDSFDTVVAHYETKLSSAEVIKPEDGEKVAIFKTADFNLEIKVDESANTLIIFSAPDGFTG